MANIQSEVTETAPYLQAWTMDSTSEQKKPEVWNRSNRSKGKNHRSPWAPGIQFRRRIRSRIFGRLESIGVLAFPFVHIRGSTLYGPDVQPFPPCTWVPSWASGVEVVHDRQSFCRRLVPGKRISCQ